MATDGPQRARWAQEPLLNVRLGEVVFFLKALILYSSITNLICED